MVDFYISFQCPYDKACKCSMEDGCCGCETWAENNGVMFFEKEAERWKDKAKDLSLEVEALKQKLMDLNKPEG